MANAEHKGTASSNNNQTSEQNEKNKPNRSEPQDAGNEFPGVNEVREHHEQEEAGVGAPDNVTEDQVTLGNNYWDSVADDVASGYTTDEDENSILNQDQLPDDHERGDKAE
jgi:hypothetical protein